MASHSRSFVFVPFYDPNALVSFLLAGWHSCASLRRVHALIGIVTGVLTPSVFYFHPERESCGGCRGKHNMDVGHAIMGPTNRRTCRRWAVLRCTSSSGNP